MAARFVAQGCRHAPGRHMFWARMNPNNGRVFYVEKPNCRPASTKLNSAHPFVDAASSVFCFFLWPFGRTPDFGRLDWGGVRVLGGPCERLIVCSGSAWRTQVRVRSIRSGWEQGVERGQGGGVQSLLAYIPALPLGPAWYVFCCVCKG